MKNVQPNIPSYCLIDRHGAVSGMNAAAPSKVMREEFQPHRSDPNHAAFLKQFVDLLHSESFTVIERLEHIPGYTARPLPQAAVESLNALPPAAADSEVFLAWQQIGGILRRYEFHYDAAGAFQETMVTEIGTNIGRANYHR